jgi:SAM-dependent methyltransferase
MQRQVTHSDVIPFIESHGFSCISRRVLEIGCAEAGVLKAFIEKNNIGVGVELSPLRTASAKMFLSAEIEQGSFFILNKNIYDINDPYAEFGDLFDLIVLKDVIEHIPEQEKFIVKLRQFLKPEGVIFFAYPPWQMPFGGHQQICHHKFLRTLPWIHILPAFIYKSILQLFGEPESVIAELLELKSTGISIEKMYHILNQHNYKILGETHWFINPIYRYKFGFKSKKVIKILTKLPFIRNFYTTAHYIMFMPK